MGCRLRRFRSLTAELTAFISVLSCGTRVIGIGAGQGGRSPFDCVTPAMGLGAITLVGGDGVGGSGTSGGRAGSDGGRARTIQMLREKLRRAQSSVESSKRSDAVPTSSAAGGPAAFAGSRVLAGVGLGFGEGEVAAEDDYWACGGDEGSGKPSMDLGPFASQGGREAVKESVASVRSLVQVRVSRD